MGAADGTTQAASDSRGHVHFGAAFSTSCLAWLIGLALQLHQPELWPTAHYTAALTAAGSVALLAGTARRRAPRAMLAAAAVALLLGGFAWAGLCAASRLSDRLSPSLEGRDLEIIGVVATMVQHAPHGLRFQFRVESAHHGGEQVPVPRRISLGWWRGWNGEGGPGGAVGALEPGQRWRFTVRLKQPHGNANPGGFDVEGWMFEHGLGASGSVQATPEQPPAWLGSTRSHPFESARQALRDAVIRAVPDPRAAGVLAALAVGDQGAIEREDWELFRASGVAHLMSISGLHVTMFAWLAGWCIGWLWRRSAHALRRMTAPKAALWGGVAAAALYAALSGWGVPAQRTVWMLVCAAGLRSAGLRWPWPLVLGAAAWTVTLWDPWALLQPGFWLSFAAVGLLLASEAAREDRSAEPAAFVPAWRRALSQAVRTQVLATVCLAPLTLVCFQQLSLIGFAANLLAIPLVTLAITPLALLGVLAPPLWTAAALLVQALTAVLEPMVALPAAVWTAGSSPLWAQALGLVGGAVAALPLPWRVRALALPLMLPVLWPAQPVPPEGRFHLIAADVGQGTAVLVRTHDHLLLYDTGPQVSPDSDAGQRVLLPLLRWRGEREIDLLVVSHRDIDHAGGAATLLSRWPVRAMSSSLEPAHPLRHLGVPHAPCEAGQSWDWDGVRFEMLHPHRDLLARHDTLKPNALSCVLRVSDRDGRSVLLAGDLEAEQERALVASLGAALSSDVLLVPHHGSATSSTEGFLQAVGPSVAVVQAGYRNRFGHPAAAVVERYASRGIPLVRSDRCGAWQWDGEHAVCERQRVPRYWQHRFEVEPRPARAPDR